ncbi:FAD-dependent monooxygenase [Altererythrobacter sp. FM1]|uniref:FAD-dependent oxidoreductase n=1 Tax=Tsuneonella flava TaxID=2055955 RepID=UPI000C80141D|nr:NAD(P)/FAD-dependent oxidoreductase [Tsuneonella flava]ROT94862.1 FAD-dependent monooxygenase [Altererythrobacter sp. FM1]
MSPYRIAIAGCGPAGLAAALLLTRDGHRVELFERFAAPRPLGSGLMIQPTGLAVLEQLGLAGEVVAHGARITRLKGINERGRIALDARYADLGIPGIFGLGIHRASLFDILYRAVNDAGIRIHSGCEVTACSSFGPTHRMTFTDGQQSEAFDLIVDALGIHSPLMADSVEPLPYGALWTTVTWPEGGPFDESLLEQRYRKAHQMVGVLPTGHRPSGGTKEAAFFWSLRRADYAAWRSAGLDQWKDDVRELWPDCAILLDQIAHADQLTFARYAHRTAANPPQDGIVRIGDAWHCASPQLGQGANMALLDAWAIAAGLREGSSLSEGVRLALSWRSDHVRLYQWLTAAFTPLYQSDAAMPAAIRDRVLAPLARIWPISRIQALLVGGLFGGALAPLGLPMPDYQVAGSTASSTNACASGLDQS